MDWTTYVRRVIGNDKQVEVSRKTGVDQTTVSRWLNPQQGGGRISSQSVAAFARGYNQPVLEAFVAAGFLTAREAGVKVKPRNRLEDFSTPDIAAELHRRLTS